MKKICDKQAFKKKVRISDLPADTQVIGSRFVLTWKEVANKVASAVGGMISLDYANPNRPFAEGKQNDRTTEKAGHVHHIQLTFSDAFDLAMRARPTFPKAGRKEAACDHGYKNPCKLGGGNRDPREPLGMVLRAHLEGGLQLVRRGTPTANVDIQLRIMDGKL